LHEKVVTNRSFIDQVFEQQILAATPKASRRIQGHAFFFALVSTAILRFATGNHQSLFALQFNLL